MKLLCLSLISDKHFQDTFANRFLESRVTIFVKLSPGCVYSTPCTGRGWGEDTSHPWQGLWEVILVLLAQSLGSLTASIWQRAPRLLARRTGSSAERTRPSLAAASLPSTLHSLPKQKEKGENPQIRLTVELSLPFLRTAAKLTHR